MKTIGIILGIILTIATVIGFIYGMWTLQRYINYTFQYETLVQETVKSMVKSNCLETQQQKESDNAE